MSSFEEEWAQLKRETAVPTRLASAEGSSDADAKAGGPKGDLTVSSEAWSKYSAVASSLYYSTHGGLTQLAKGQQGLAANTAGFASATAQRSLYACWRERLEAVRDECQYIASDMLMVRDTYDAGERDITSSFESSRDK